LGLYNYILSQGWHPEQYFIVRGATPLWMVPHHFVRRASKAQFLCVVPHLVLRGATPVCAGCHSPKENLTLLCLWGTTQKSYA